MMDHLGRYLLGLSTAFHAISVDVVILIGFLLLNMVVGMHYRGKKQSFSEYVIGNKQFSTATLVATTVATWVSGSTLFLCLEETYRRGLYFIIAIMVGSPIGLLLTGRVIAPRLGKFANDLSVPESLGKLYGKTTQTIAGIASIFMGAGYIAAQFKIVARVLAVLFEHESPILVVVTAIIVTSYSLFGGVRAVTLTDVLQLFTFGTLLPILALTVWNSISEHGKILEVLATNPHFKLQAIFRWSPESMDMLTLMSYVMIPTLAPELFQRMVMARDATQVKQAMTYSTLLFLVINLCAIGIGVLILADHPGLATDQVVRHTFDAYTVPGLKGLLGVGVIAMAMSTADSTINATAAVIANDVLAPLGMRRNPLRTAQYATLVLGMLSVFLSLHVQGLLEIIFMAACFYSPIVTVPMMLAIFGFQTSKRVVLMAMGVGATTVIAYGAVFGGVQSFLPGMLANLITMLAGHYMLKKVYVAREMNMGWGNNPIYNKQEKQFLNLLRPSWKVRDEQKKFQLSVYLKNTLPTEDQLYGLFGFYVFASTYASFYFLPQEITVHFPRLYSIIQYTVLILFTTFSAYPIWPNVMKSKRLLAWVWPLYIFYSLFGVGGALVVLSGLSKVQILIFLFNFVIAVLLLDWPMAMIMAITGAGLVALTLGHSPDIVYTSEDQSTLPFIVAYGLLVYSSTLIVRFKGQQARNAFIQHHRERLNEREMTPEELNEAKRHTAHPLSEISASSVEMMTAIKGRMAATTHRSVDDTAVYLQELIRFLQADLPLEISHIALEQLLEKATMVFMAQYLQRQPRPRMLNTATTRMLECDPARVQQLLVNAWLYAYKNKATQQFIHVNIQNTTLGYPVPSKKTYIKVIPALCITVGLQRALPTPRTLYLGAMAGNYVPTTKATLELSLLENQQITKAHYGALEFIHSKHNTPTQVYVLPIHLREVRPDITDLLARDKAAPEQAHAVVASTKAGAEAKLLALLKDKTSVDMNLAKKAITYVKQHLKDSLTDTHDPTHAFMSTGVLIDYTEDQNTLLAALIQEVAMCTSNRLPEIGAIFGPEVAVLINQGMHWETAWGHDAHHTQENILQHLEATDRRVLQVKLAQYLYRTRRGKDPTSEQQLKNNAMKSSIFVAVAHHLGLPEIATELQETAYPKHALNTSQQPHI